MNSKREVIRKGNLQSNIASLVRLPTESAEPVHALIKQVLHVDVHGVVIPLVRTTAEAEKIVKVCRHVLPEGSKIKVPIGMRGASPWLSSFFWGVRWMNISDELMFGP